MKKKLYYVETGAGCGIRIGRNAGAVEKAELKAVGYNNGVRLVREATEEDITHVKAMGGYIPKL